MWIKQMILVVLGLSAGVAAAGGLFSFIVGLGVVSEFADRTHTGDCVLLYEESIALGGIFGKNTARISVLGVSDQPGVAFKIFHTLAKNNINVDIILQSVGREGTKDISFTVSQEDLKPALAILEEYQEPMTIREIKWEDTVAKISIVGAGMMSNPGVAAKLFESLYNNRININMISTSEIRITVLIDDKEIDKAMQAVHDGFGLGDV